MEHRGALFAGEISPAVARNAGGVMLSADKQLKLS
jgi:hypothetical protein